MGRSPPLRVYYQRLERPFRTRFRFASSAKRLRLATDSNSQTHYAKGTPSPSTNKTARSTMTRPHLSDWCWALTPCKHIISGTISLRSQRFFSPFPRGTCSLSVANEYLGLRRGRRRFIRSFTCIVLLRKSLGVLRLSVTGLSPSMAQLSRSFT
jgi:hypothetical protein